MQRWMGTGILLSLLLATGLGAWLGCTDTNVYIPSVDPNIPNKVTVSGTVCTDDPAERRFPVKVMFIVDTSGSMSANDAELHRMLSVQDIISRYNASHDYEFAIIKFAGEALQLTVDGYTDQQNKLNDAIAGLGTIDPCADGYCRNYSAALSLASAIFTGDVLVENPGSLSRTRYVFIFITNGPPYPPDPAAGDFQSQLDNLEQNYIAAIEEMADFGYDQGAAEIAFHTVQLDDTPGTCVGTAEMRYCNSNIPCPPDCQGGELCGDAQRRCSEDHNLLCESSDDCVDRCEALRVCSNDVNITCANDSTCCPTFACDDPNGLVNDGASAMLQAMAFAGRGAYQRYSIGPQLNLRGLDFETTLNVFVKKAFMVTNDNAKTICGKLYADSDAEGLSDREEACYGEILSGECRKLDECHCSLDVWSKQNPAGTDTDPTLADTDGDGLGDMLETLFATVNLNPLQVDLPQACHSLPRPYKDHDGDGDGLNDCEEKLLGTDPNLFDSDRDGYPDRVEFKAGSNYLRADNLRDTDMDGIDNGTELMAHLDPQCNDTAADAYRYKIIDEGLRLVPFATQPKRIFGTAVANVAGRSGQGAGELFYYPVGTRRKDGSLRDRPALAWRDPADGSHGVEVPITSSGDYVLYASCACVQDCPGGADNCDPGWWCNPASGQCVVDPCAHVPCASTETCDPFQGRCVTDCTKSDCAYGERCDPLLGRCLIDLCLNKDCPSGQACDTEAGRCAGPPCAGWQCPAGLRLDEDGKPPWVVVHVEQDQLPQSGFYCDGAQGTVDCLTDADCPDNSLCRLRELLVVSLAHKNCMSFKVKNVTLVETLETQSGSGPGYNNLFVYFAQTPLDNPYAFSIFRAALYQMEFVRGIKFPDIAVVSLDNGDFFLIEEK